MLGLLLLAISTLTNPASAQERSHKYQFGVESGAVFSYDGQYSGSPVLATGAVLIPTRLKVVVRPHLATGALAPAGVPVVREGLMLVKPFKSGLAIGAGGIAIQAFTPDGVKLNWGANLAGAYVPKSGGLGGYLGCALTRNGPIGVAGANWTF